VCGAEGGRESLGSEDRVLMLNVELEEVVE
jgi:hypothetical protein